MTESHNKRCLLIYGCNACLVMRQALYYNLSTHMYDKNPLIAILNCCPLKFLQKDMVKESKVSGLELCREHDAFDEDNQSEICIASDRRH